MRHVHVKLSDFDAARSLRLERAERADDTRRTFGRTERERELRIAASIAEEKARLESLLASGVTHYDTPDYFGEIRTHIHR